LLGEADSAIRIPVASDPATACGRNDDDTATLVSGALGVRLRPVTLAVGLWPLVAC